MQRVVIDTNVLISALIQKSYPYLIIQGVLLNEKVELCLSELLFSEYYEVLHRPKFSKFHDFVNRAELLLTNVERRGVFYYPKKRVDLIRDTDDNMILELAEESRADFIITGNRNDFQLSKYLRTHIITPREYWETNWLGL